MFTTDFAPLQTPVEIFVGGIRPMPGSGRPSGIYKTQVSAPVAFATAGLAGDQQADREVHGGEDKAVHYYPIEHYGTLAAAFDEITVPLSAGTLGENLSGAGLNEDSVFVGDIFVLGETRLQVTQPRQPCWKIDARLGQEGVSAYIAEHGCMGWYLRVLTSGTVKPGDSLRLVERMPGNVSLAQLWHTWQALRPDLDTLKHWLAMPGLSANWRKKITQRLAWLQANGDAAGKGASS